MYGYVKNFNTLQEFKDADKQAYFYQVVDEVRRTHLTQIWGAITGDASEKRLATVNDPNCFLLLTYADLKSYKYYYWFAFPALVAKLAWSISEPGWQLASKVLGAAALSSIHDKLPSTPLPYFLARPSGNNFDIAPISEFSAFFANIPPS